MNLKFKYLVYQIVVGEHLVVVLDDFDDAKKYVAENLRNAEVLILPIPVYEYS